MIKIPADVSIGNHSKFVDNYNSITKNTNNLMLFAADQKIEHLNDDFYGSFIHPDANSPENLFKIASQGIIGAFACQYGLITRYANDYNDINYIVKLNSKTDLIINENRDPLSNQLWEVDDVLSLQKNNPEIKIRGVGYTIYLGSEFENIMLAQAAKVITQAHQNGLVSILWIYPRGKNIKNRSDLSLISGAAGIANALGSDFVKIKPPKKDGLISENDILKIASQAAGNTKIICSGEQFKPTEIFLKELYDQIHNGGTFGCATGRNIFQRSLSDAMTFTKAISAIVYNNNTPSEALCIYKNNFINT